MFSWIIRCDIQKITADNKGVGVFKNTLKGLYTLWTAILKVIRLQCALHQTWEYRVSGTAGMSVEPSNQK